MTLAVKYPAAGIGVFNPCGMRQIPFSVSEGRAGITAGDDLRGLETYHQQAFSRNSENGNPAKYATLWKIVTGRWLCKKEEEQPVLNTISRLLFCSLWFFQSAGVFIIVDRKFPKHRAHQKG